MNGWQRIGVVLSVVWAIGAFLTVRSIEFDTARHQMAVTYRLCADFKTSRNDFDFSDCAKEQARTWNNWTSSTVTDGLAVALLPIPFGWVLAELIGGAIVRLRSKTEKTRGLTSH